MEKKNKKAISIILIVTIVQSIIYYLVKLGQTSPTLIGSSLDNYIPFISYFVYFYVMWYLMLVIVPYTFYKHNKNDFLKYITLYILAGITADIIFLVFPTTIQRASIIPTNFTLQIVDIVYFFDIPILNCLPSMHCIASFIFIVVAITSKTLKRNYKIIISILSILVVMSTLLIKQHVIYDVVSALIIVIIYEIIYEKFIKNKITQ